MGSWALRPHGLELLSSNQAESFNAQLKRFVGKKEQSIDMMILSVLRFQEFRENEVKLAQFRLGGEWTLRPHLYGQYDANDPSAEIPKMHSIDDYLNRVKAARNAENSNPVSATHDLDVYYPADVSCISHLGFCMNNYIGSYFVTWIYCFKSCPI